MAYIKTDAILTRIRELVEGGYGSLRAITSTRFSGGLHEGQDPTHHARLGILAQKPSEASITKVLPHPQRLVVGGSVQIHLLEIEVRIVRTVAIDGQVDDSIRDAAKALAAQDADALAQVLEWPGNLVSTQAGATTDLKGLFHMGSRHTLKGTAGEAMRLDTVHTFSGTALSRPATS